MIGSLSVAAGRVSTVKSRMDSSLSVWHHNIYMVVSVVYVVWITIGTVFYHYMNEWDWPTSFFFTLEMEHAMYSRIFTVIYLLIGSSIVAGTLGRFASEILFSKVRISAKERKLLKAAVDVDGDGRVGFLDVVGYYWYSFKVIIGWYRNRMRIKIVLAATAWAMVGTAYGLLFEEWSFIQSLYFAVSALSTAGLQTPTCNGPDGYDCTLGRVRGTYLGIYILVGVPLYACAMGQFAGVFIDQAVRQRERERMKQPIDARDFEYATTLLSKPTSTTLEPGEFILMELMRLGKTNRKQIQKIMERFKQLDVKQNNVLDYDELRMGGYVVTGKKHPSYASFEEKHAPQESPLAKARVAALSRSLSDSDLSASRVDSIRLGDGSYSAITMNMASTPPRIQRQMSGGNCDIPMIPLQPVGSALSSTSYSTVSGAHCKADSGTSQGMEYEHFSESDDDSDDELQSVNEKSRLSISSVRSGRSGGVSSPELSGDTDNPLVPPTDLSSSNVYNSEISADVGNCTNHVR